MDFNIFSHIYGYDNISSKFDFQGPGLKVNVVMTETCSIMWNLIPPNLKIWTFTTLYLNDKALYNLNINVIGFSIS